MQKCLSNELAPDGHLVSLNPGKYVRVKQTPGVSYDKKSRIIKIPAQTNAILIEHQGVHHQTNKECWSALVDDSLILVWQDDYSIL